MPDAPNSPRRPALAPPTRPDDDLESRLQQMGDLGRRLVHAVRLPDVSVDLTPTQFVVLSLLDDQPMRIGVLASAAGAAQNTISEVVARLSRTGMVSKTHDPQDRRAVLVEIAPAGKKALDAKRSTMRAYHRDLLGTLSLRDRKKFVEAFEFLVRVAEAVRTQVSQSSNSSRRMR